MKKMKTTSKLLFITVLAGLMLFNNSCQKDLLEQDPTVDLFADAFWKTEDDATFALMGAYGDIRYLFDRDYFFDGNGEYFKARGQTLSKTVLRNGMAYSTPYSWSPTGYGSQHDIYFKSMYLGVIRANYVIENVEKMLPDAKASSIANLEAIIGEARLLRGMIYFRLISMWGDVPYIDFVPTNREEAAGFSRMPLAQVKDKIMADFTYAFEKVPTTNKVGRAAKPAALGLRGKLQLYWACWNKFGWPELDTFSPDAAAADAAYKAAAEDFKKVINDYGLTLFRNGEPGNIDELGKAVVLPNYYYLFTPVANGSKEMIMTFNHGLTGTFQGEELMRDFAGRTLEFSQAWVTPRFEVADRYQSIITGDFVDPLIPMNPTTNPNARTTANSAVNPQSYANRDYRMKSTILWDYEMTMGIFQKKETGWSPWIYRVYNTPVTINGEVYRSYNTDGSNSGYVFRKFVRNTAGHDRSNGNFAWPVMRLADVYLMYAEASNEAYGPQADAVEVVNKVRHRGNLPPLAAAKISSKANFFDAIEQERIVELIGEGHRNFDLRRWRAIERVWGLPGGSGKRHYDTYGIPNDLYYQNANELTYQRAYIYKIPGDEINRNPNMTQNTPWQ